MRRWMLAPLVVLGVLVVHGLADAGTPYVHAMEERSMGAHHSAPAPDHSSSHLGAMSICAFALLVAVHQLRRSAALRRALGSFLTTWAGRIATGPEPPVPRLVV